ncbi:MAG: hypothetical protein ABIE70_01985 [bacterium]
MRFALIISVIILLLAVGALAAEIDLDQAIQTELQLIQSSCLWQDLEKMSSFERSNSIITLEVAAEVSRSARKACDEVEFAWNTGDCD